MYASGYLAGAVILIKVPSTAPITPGNPYRSSIVVDVSSHLSLVGQHMNTFRSLYNAFATLRTHRQAVALPTSNFVHTDL